MSATVTVLIPSYNPGSYLRHALKSVIDQTYPHWKVIVVDDCSTDYSLYGAKYFLQSSRIDVIRNGSNLGQSKSLNIGLKQVDTPYTVQLDSDDWFPLRALERLVMEAEDLPDDVGVVHGNMKVVVEESSPSSPYLPSSLVKKGRQYSDRYDFLLSNSSVWPRFYLTSALRDIGGWPTDDPFNGRYLEDKRILFRLIEKYRFHWIDEVLYVHRRHDYNQTENKMQVYSYITEWNIRDALRRWGDPREPVFEVNENGWKYIVALQQQNDGEVHSKSQNP